MPDCFFVVGAGGEDWAPHHNPLFKLDERALPVGIETMTETARRFLAD